MGILEVGGFLYKLLNLIVPAAIVVISIMFAGSIIKGWKNFFFAVKMILTNKLSFLFFIVIILGFFFLWNELKTIIGW